VKQLDRGMVVQKTGHEAAELLAQYQLPGKKNRTRERLRYLEAQAPQFEDNVGPNCQAELRMKSQVGCQAAVFEQIVIELRLQAARAKSRTCLGLTTATAIPLVARALATGVSRPPVASRITKSGGVSCLSNSHLPPDRESSCTGPPACGSAVPLAGLTTP